MAPIRGMDLGSALQAHRSRDQAVVRFGDSARRALGATDEGMAGRSSVRTFVDTTRSRRVDCPPGPIQRVISVVASASAACSVEAIEAGGAPIGSVCASAPREVPLQLAVPSEPLSETLPTSGPTGYEERPDPDLHSHGLHQKPGLSGRQRPRVPRRKFRSQVVVGYGDRELAFRYDRKAVVPEHCREGSDLDVAECRG